MLDYRMKILALRVYRIYFLQQKLDCNMYLLTYNLSELVFHKISAMQSLRYLSNKYYLLRSLCLHLLCEVTINSICKNFFFHPHMHIESKKAYISDICFRMQSEIQQIVKLLTIDFIARVHIPIFLLFQAGVVKSTAFCTQLLLFLTA